VSQRIAKSEKAMKGKFKYKCYYCRKVGHKIAKCTEPSKGIDNANAVDDVSLHITLSLPKHSA